MTQNSTDLVRRVIERCICFRSVPEDVRVDLYPDFIRDDVDLIELRWLLGQDIRCLGLYGQPDPGLKPPVITLNDILSSPVLDSRHRPLHRLVKQPASGVACGPCAIGRPSTRAGSRARAIRQARVAGNARELLGRQ